jgi:hypothetical protein
MCAWHKDFAKDTVRPLTKRRYCDRFQNLPISILSVVRYVSFAEDHLTLSDIVGFILDTELVRIYGEGDVGSSLLFPLCKHMHVYCGDRRHL